MGKKSGAGNPPANEIISGLIASFRISRRKEGVILLDLSASRISQSIFSMSRIISRFSSMLFPHHQARHLDSER